MLYLIFGFFGASIGAALELVLGPLAFWRFDDVTIPGLSDGPYSFVNSYTLGMLLGALFGGVIGLFFARKISRKE